MDRLARFIKNRWEEALIWGLAVNLIAWSLTTGKPVLIISIVLSVAAVIVLVYLAIERAGRRRTKKMIGESTAFTIQRQAILFTVGKQIDTIVFALENQRPRFVGFICTEASQSYVDEIIARLKFKEDDVRKRIVNPFDIHEIYQTANLLMDWMLAQDLAPAQLVVDVTGGMTTMSVGVFSAADERLVDSQYIRSKYDDQNKVIPGTMEGVFIIHYPEPTGETERRKG